MPSSFYPPLVNCPYYPHHLTPKRFSIFIHLHIAGSTGKINLPYLNRESQPLLEKMSISTKRKTEKMPGKFSHLYQDDTLNLFFICFELKGRKGVR
jgi:hypothetical protein